MNKNKHNTFHSVITEWNIKFTPPPSLKKTCVL